MRTLILFRHAKSDWSDPGVTDFDRPLNARGHKAAQRMGAWLRDQGLLPDLVLCSAARRARETWVRVATALDQDVPVRTENDLYLAEPEQILEIVHHLEVEPDRLLIVGHNPGIEQTALRLVGGPEGPALERMRAKFPTAAAAVIRCEIESWRELSEGMGRLREFVRPKDLE